MHAAGLQLNRQMAVSLTNKSEQVLFEGRRAAIVANVKPTEY